MNKRKKWGIIAGNLCHRRDYVFSLNLPEEKRWKRK